MTPTAFRRRADRFRLAAVQRSTDRRSTVQRSTGRLGALLLSAVLLTAGCANAVTGTANPAATSARGSAVSPVLPSPDETRTASTGTSASRTVAAPTDLPTIGTTRPAVTTPASTTRRNTTPKNPTTPSPTTPAPAPDTEVADTTAAASALTIDHFSSPTGNITCMIADFDGGPTVRCDLAESNITQQHDCGGTGDWGWAVSLLRGEPASMICVSDTVMAPGLPVLAYGDSTTVDGLTCTSRENGMTCRDDAGHQFRLARNDYEVK